MLRLEIGRFTLEIPRIRRILDSISGALSSLIRKERSHDPAIKAQAPSLLVHRADSRAFTCELLVVIAIIAMLVGLAGARRARGREAARRTYGVRTIRQNFAKAMLSYDCKHKTPPLLSVGPPIRRVN